MKKINTNISKMLFATSQDFFAARDKMYSELSIAQMIQELKEYDIHLDVDRIQQQILKIGFDNVVEFYNEKYETQLDILAGKCYLFDDDAILYVVEKIMEN